MSRSARLLGGFFTFAGLMHFARPKPYEAIMPPYVPAHGLMVRLSGAAEAAGGVGAFFPSAHRGVRWWLTAVLIAIFPANLHMALHPDEIKGLPAIPRWLLWARLPLQLVFIAWVWHATRES